MSDEKQPRPEDEVEHLNADDLDIEELDDKDLDEAAGGCWDMTTCGTMRKLADSDGGTVA